jgi:hypothetical protein
MDVNLSTLAPWGGARDPDGGVRRLGRMSRKSRIFSVSLLCFAFSFMFVPTASAYIDPGTGSFMFQALVGAMLAVGLTVKLFWRRIGSLVARRDRSADDG